MILNIRVTDRAIKYLQDNYRMEEEEAGEVAQTVISLCEISGTPTPKYSEEKNLLRDLGDLISRRKGDTIFEDWVFPPAVELRNALEQAIDEPEDLLFKTADSLMRYYAEKGAEEFSSRFGSLDIIEVCRKVIREGEGSPHPWEGEGRSEE